MKRKTNAYLLGLFFLIGCGAARDKSEDAVSGTYVREINNEFAKGNDSLIVSVLDKEAGTFSIIKNYGFIRYLDGQEKGRDHKTENYTGVYDRERKQLHDDFKGKVFTFVPDKNILLMGSSEYRKVK